MKKYALSLFVFLGLMGGSCLGQEVPQAESAKAPQGLFGREKAAWSKGIAAAKKRHWNRKRLTAQEKSYYNALLKRVGTVAGIIALIGAGAYVVKRHRQWQRQGAEYDAREAAQQAEHAQYQQQAQQERQDYDGFLGQCERDELEPSDCLNRIIRSPYSYDERTVDIVAQILERRTHTDLEQADDVGDTLLISAIDHGQRGNQQYKKAIIEALLDAGADPTVQSLTSSPLKQAINLQDQNLVEMLLEGGAGQSGGSTAELTGRLRQAATAERPNIGIMQALVRHGADPDEKQTATLWGRGVRGQEVTESAKEALKRQNYNPNVLNVGGSGAATKGASKR